MTKKSDRKEKTQRKNTGEDFKSITIGAANRAIYSNNDVKFIYARKGDTFYSIARDFNIYTWQVYKYNDLKKKDKIAEGQMIYLERKKTKATRNYHTVQPGETLHDIAQYYGIRLSKLCKYNTLSKGSKISSSRLSG